MGVLLQTVERLIAALVLILSVATPAQKAPQNVNAAHYGPGVMERVARNRNMKLVDCMMSSPWHPLNTWIRVKSRVNGESALCRTTDVSAPKDRPRHQRKRIIELDWETARRLCGVKRVGQKPARSCPASIEVVSAKAVKAQG